MKQVKFHTKGTVDFKYGQFDQNEQPFRTKDNRYLLISKYLFD